MGFLSCMCSVGLEMAVLKSRTPSFHQGHAICYPRRHRSCGRKFAAQAKVCPENVISKCLWNKSECLGRKFFSGLDLETRSNASSMCTPDFMAVSSHGFPEANESKWRHPVKAVSNGVNITYTQAHTDNEILSEGNSCLDIFPFYERQLGHFFKKV